MGNKNNKEKQKKNTGVDAIPFSKGSSDSGIEPESPALQADSLPLTHQCV